MAPTQRPRKVGKGEEPSGEDPMAIDASLNNAEKQGAPQAAASFHSQADVPPSGFHGSSLSSHTLNHPSSHTLSHKPAPAKIRPSGRRSSPDKSVPSASPEVRLKPSSSAVDTARRWPGYESGYNCVGHPPGYIRHSGPVLRQSETTDWPHGVLSGGALIRFLEDISRSSRDDVCVWLDAFVARFGRIRNLDGLIVTNPQDMHMLMLAHRFWLGIKGAPVEGDIFWVPGLEPLENIDPNWEARAKIDLPKLPSTYSQKPWNGGEVQYLHGTSIERPRKGKMVGKIQDDGMQWEWNIWRA